MEINLGGNPPLKRTKTSESETKAKPQYFSDENIGNSDNEFDNATINCLFTKDKAVHASQVTLTVKNISNQPQNIKGDKLITLVHEYILKCYENYIDGAHDKDDFQQPIFPIPIVKNDIIFISEPMFWLMALGGGNKKSPKSEVTDYFLYWHGDTYGWGEKNKQFKGIRIGNNIFHITNERLYLPEHFKIGNFDVTAYSQYGKTVYKNDLTYKQIYAAISHIKQIFNINDKQFAQLQLIRVKDPYNIPKNTCNIPEKEYNEIIQFIDYLNCLMFIIEASGLNVGLITGIMTLELITLGHINYKQAFVYDNYGGAYPYANSDRKSAGTYTKRAEILGSYFYQKSKDEFDNTEKKNGIYHLFDSNEYIQVVDGKQNKLTLKKDTKFNGDGFILMKEILKLFGNYTPRNMRVFRKIPDHSPTALKEAIIIRNWIIAKGGILEKFSEYDDNVDDWFEYEISEPHLKNYYKYYNYDQYF